MTHSFLSPCISLAITQPAHPLGAVGAPDDLVRHRYGRGLCDSGGSSVCVQFVLQAVKVYQPNKKELLEYLDK